MIVAVDFDGTVVRHEYPDIGPEVPGAVATLRALVARGDRLILWTEREGAALADAVEWFRVRDIALWGVNDNREQGIRSTISKVAADVYIDDAAIGAPMVPQATPGSYVLTTGDVFDWLSAWNTLGLPWPQDGTIPYRWEPPERLPFFEHAANHIDPVLAGAAALLPDPAPQADGHDTGAEA